MPARHNFENNEKDIISEYIKGLNSSELGEKYNTTNDCVLSLLKRNNIYIRNASERARKHKLNEMFFDQINSPEKAYFLGILYADGNNSIKWNRVSLKLKEEDKELLEKLSMLVYYDKRPLLYRRGSQFKSPSTNKYYHRKGSYALNINNKHISETLIRHGVVAKKSLILTFPEWMPENLLSHFVRGYFDGDGCIYITKKQKQLGVSIMSTNNFCISLQEILEKINIKSIICQAKNYIITKDMHINGNENVKNFMKWIYKDATIYMQRKYNKYLSCIDIREKAIKEREIKKQNKIKRVCMICGDKHDAKGYCKKHYKQIIRNPKRKQERQAKLSKSANNFKSL